MEKFKKIATPKRIFTTRAEADEFGKQGVTMNMNSYGTREWEKLTSRVAKEQGFIAIVMDNTVYSAPQVNEAIAGGSSRISGNFTIEDAQELTKILGWWCHFLAAHINPRIAVVGFNDFVRHEFDVFLYRIFLETATDQTLNGV